LFPILVLLNVDFGIRLPCLSVDSGQQQVRLTITIKINERNRMGNGELIILIWFLAIFRVVHNIVLVEIVEFVDVLVDGAERNGKTFEVSFVRRLVEHIHVLIAIQIEHDWLRVAHDL